MITAFVTVALAIIGVAAIIVNPAIIIVAAIIITASILVVLGIGWIMSSSVAKPKYFSIEDAKKIEQDMGVYGNYDQLDKTDYVISSYDNYQIHATFIPSQDVTNRYVIISHGYGYNRMGSVKYVHLFRKMGYNCIIYDTRGHGENLRTTNLMGLIEHKDLLQVIEDTYRRYGSDIYLGLHGESMGSSLSVMALSSKPEIKFLISDCGYADLTKILTRLMKQQNKLPAWLIYPISIISKLRFGLLYQDVAPYKDLQNNEVPVLFIHGEEDSFILPEHAQIMFESDSGYKALLLVPEAEHAKSLITDADGYYEKVNSFLQEI